MKVSGARWNLESARSVAKACAAYLSDQWDNLAQLYPNPGFIRREYIA